MPAGTFLEKKNNAAAAINNMPTPEYKKITLESFSAAILSSGIADALAAVPNNAKATTIGPMVVPKEFTPPPRFTRHVPVEGSPNAIAVSYTHLTLPTSDLV